MFHRLALSLSLIFGLSACSAPSDINQPHLNSFQSQSLETTLLPDQTEMLGFFDTATDDSYSLKFNIKLPSSDFKTQALDYEKFAYINLYIRMNGSDVLIENNEGFVPFQDQEAKLTVKKLPHNGSVNNIVKAVAYDSDRNPIPGAVLWGYFNAPQRGTRQVQVKLNWRTFLSGKLLNELWDSNPELAKKLNIEELQAFSDQVLRMKPKEQGGFDYEIHPTVVNREVLNSLIVGLEKNLSLEKEGLKVSEEIISKLSREAILEQNLKGYVTGLTRGEKISIYYRDPASPISKFKATGSELGERYLDFMGKLKLDLKNPTEGQFALKIVNETRKEEIIWEKRVRSDEKELSLNFISYPELFDLIETLYQMHYEKIYVQDLRQKLKCDSKEEQKPHLHDLFERHDKAMISKDQLEKNKIDQIDQRKQFEQLEKEKQFESVEHEKRLDIRQEDFYQKYCSLQAEEQEKYAGILKKEIIVLKESLKEKQAGISKYKQFQELSNHSAITQAEKYVVNLILKLAKLQVKQYELYQ